MELRGFDGYEITLGDEMRGERASLGKSLSSAERDLRIRAELLEAIENGDCSAFPNQSVVSGYVRSYARYLGMDPEDVYRRFCEASGFVPPNARFHEPRAGARGDRRPVQTRQSTPFETSRFISAQPQTRFHRPVSLGSIVSGLGLVAVLAGLGYGGFALLQSVQRVGFEPLPQAPEVVAEAPRFTAPALFADEAAASEGYDGTAGLSGALAPVHLPDTPLRDGPIASIDPLSYGPFAGLEERPRAEEDTVPRADRIDSADDAIRIAERRARAARAAAERAAEARAGAIPALPDALAERALPARTVALRVTEPVWMRLRDGEGAVLFEGILDAGTRYALPERLEGATLRAGNAGALYAVVGERVYGPLGEPGAVIKNVALDAVSLRDALPGRGSETAFAAGEAGAAGAAAQTAAALPNP
jgi:hypothetical protein